VEGFAAGAPLRIVLPLGVARQLCDRARREWGPSAVADPKPDLSRVSFYLGGQHHYRSGERPVGGFVLRWGVPTPYSATIERAGWNPAQGGSLDEVRAVVDALVGWPAATRATTPAS
jgi:hypothetical protein